MEEVMSYYLSCTKKDVDALKGSIKKWEGIAFNYGIDHGISDCPCCRLYRTINGCEGCPIKAWTGRQYCRGTPYTQWNKSTGGSGGKVNTEHRKKLAIKELNFLKDLLKICKVEL